MTERTPRTIEHNHYELPNDRTPWKSAFAMLALFWVVNLYQGDVHWSSIALGVLSGGLIASYAIVKTGNRVPESWRSPPADKR